MSFSRSALLASIVLVGGLLGCDDDDAPVCLGTPDGTASCQAACDRLYAMECLVGKDIADCVSLCSAATAPLPNDTRDRVLACYAVASSCEQIDGCGRSCGEGASIIEFGDTDGGGVDAGPPEQDGGPPEQDSGPAEQDAAAAPPADGG